MKGRRQKRSSIEFFKLVKEAEKELEVLEKLWELGVINWRDQRRYRAEVEPFILDPEDIRLNIVRIIR
jgi:hypothetical protein